MATNPRQTERESSDLGQDMRKVAAQAEQSGRAMGDAAARTTRASTEAFGRNAERAQESWQSSADAASRIAQRSMEHFSKVFGLTGDTARETLQQSSDNFQAVLDSTSVIAGGLQEVTGEWMRFAQSRLEQNFDHLDQLGECRTLHDYVALQSRIVRDNLEALLQSTERSSERSTQIARAAVDRMSSPSTAPR